jgi:hypothetical protein
LAQHEAGYAQQVVGSLEPDGCLKFLSAAGTLFHREQNLTPTVLTSTISVTALSSPVVNGNSHLNTVIAGFNVGTNVNF